MPESVRRTAGASGRNSFSRFVRREHDDGDAGRPDILLKLDVLIDRNENFEPPLTH